jgi:uncharacterized phage protein gp47/JayE
MPLQFKHYKQLLDDWLSFVVGHSTVTDINPGSIARTLGEATALEVAQVFVQLQALLNLFSIDKASGEDLDERAVDFGLTREQPTKSIGVVTVEDSALTSADVAVSTLASALTAGVSTNAQIQTTDYASFPTSGTMILDRGNGALRENIAWTSKTAPDLLNFPGGTFPLNNHDTNATVHKSTVGVDRTISAGTIVKTPAPDELKFDTTVNATLYDGDYQAINVTVQSEETGVEQNVTAGKISLFESPPFPTAVVYNEDTMKGGRDLETDEDFRTRIKETQQALSSSTVARIESEALKVKIVSTGQRVITAKVIEPIAPGESILYINDGTATYSPSTEAVAANEFLLSVAEVGQVRASFKNWPLVNNSERLFVSKDRGTATAAGVNSLSDSTKTWTTNQWAGFRLKDANDTVFTVASNTATVLTLSGGLTPNLGDYAIFNPSATVFPTGSLLTKDVDYVINNTNGQVELTLASFPAGLVAKDCLVAYYNGATDAYVYYDGLLQEVQKVINGDPNDLENYPGVKAAGTVVYVTAPSIVTVSVVATLTVQEGFDEATLRDVVKSAIVDYINNLTIGDDVIRAKIIEVAMMVTGVLDFAVITPVDNIIITNSQLAKTTLVNIVVT